MAPEDNKQGSSAPADSELEGLDEVEHWLKVITHMERELQEKNEELVRLNEELRLASITDSLTRLYNRRFFFEQAEKELERHRRSADPWGIIMLDIDHFKTINDTLGHPQGDSVLAEASALFQKSVRTHDLVARFGGEEFVVLLPQTAEEGISRAAEKIRAAVEAQEFAGMNGRRVTISIGCAPVYSGNTLSLRDILALADQALYEAKHGGRNRVSMAPMKMEDSRPRLS